MKESQITHLADLIRAISTLLWPLIAIAVVWRFHRQIESILARVRRANVFGQNLDLDEPLRQLQSDARAAAAAVAPVPQTSSSDTSTAEKASEGLEREVLEQAARSPKAALMYLSSVLERELRELLAASGWGTEKHRSFRAGIDSLQELGVLPRSVASAVDHFWPLRNKIVHGHNGSGDDILRAIDSGLTILRTLRAIPRETNTVYHPGVELYSDDAATVPQADVRGVILETTSPGGATKILRVFPTTQTHFKKGCRVAWEWNMNRGFGPTWYRQPATGTIELAWKSSAEFVGRHLDDV